MEEQMPQNKPSNPSAPLFIILGVVVLAIAALFMYFGDYGSDTNTNTVVNNTVSNINGAVNTNTENQNIPIISGSERYEGQGFTFQPPKDLYIINNEFGDIIQFATVSENPLGKYENTYMIVRWDQKIPATVDGQDIYLDTLPDSTYLIDELEANTYIFPDGYEGTPAFVVYRVAVDNIYYRFDFWNTTDTDSEEIKSILDSIIFK